MKSYILNLEKEFSLIKNGFKEQEKRALADYKAKGAKHCKELAYLDAVFLFGHLSDREEILAFMKDEVSKDENWRVQEILAKAFDEFCKKVGYEQALLTIDEWLKNGNTNAKRAVTEGLRIWTSRPYFKDNPNEAIKRLSSLKDNASEYLRKSVGNALKDISKKFPNLVKSELESWNLGSKETLQIYKFASKFIKK